MRAMVLGGFTCALAVTITVSVSALKAQTTTPRPDSDPEYLEATPAYVQFVLLPRGGWPEPSQADPTYETLRFGAPRVISFEAGEGYIEGDMIVGPRAELIAREALTNVLGPVIRPQLGESGGDAMLRSTGAQLLTSNNSAAAFRAQVLAAARETIAFRTGRDQTLAAQATAEAERIFDELASATNQRILSVTVSLGRRWPDPMNKPIPYTVRNLPGYASTWIDPAISEWTSKAGLKFVKVDTIPSGTNGISFVGGSGCSSHVGMKGGTQVIRLANGCRKAVAHEIGHALGLFYEQSHPDRDQFVTINWSNIKPGSEHNFAIKQNPGRTTVYDYNSVMHYSGTAFSRNGQPTIVPKNKAARIGQRAALSPLDIQGIKLLYAAAPQSQ